MVELRAVIWRKQKRIIDQGGGTSPLHILNGHPDRCPRGFKGHLIRHNAVVVHIPYDDVKWHKEDKEEEETYMQEKVRTA